MVQHREMRMKRMTTRRKVFIRTVTTVFAVAGLIISGGDAFAQTGPIRLIVGAAPGGSTDMVARSIAKEMTEILGQSVVVENKAGAAGNIAGEYVAHSAPDGNTLLVSYTSFSANTSLYKKTPYDPVKDFAPISMLGLVPSVLVVGKDFPAGNMEEFLELVRANPGKYTAGIGGLGSSLHMATEILKAKANVNVVNVPYKGAGPAMADLLGGHIDLMFAAAMAVQGVVSQGTVKVLGVTSNAPLKEFPGAFPISDTVEGFESSSWYGIFGPAGLTPDVVEHLNKVARAAVASPGYQNLMASQAATASSSTPDELAAFLKKDIAKYAEVVKLTGVSMD